MKIKVIMVLKDEFEKKPIEFMHQMKICPPAIGKKNHSTFYPVEVRHNVLKSFIAAK